MDRRALLLTGLAASVARPARAQPRPDVIVVGAGLAGLSAALTLQDAGARVRVIEAQERPGGRLRTGSGGGLTIDVGAVEVGPHYRRVRAWAARTGVEIRPITRRFGGFGYSIRDTLVSAADWPTSPANLTVGTEREIAPASLEARLLRPLSPIRTVDQAADPAFSSFDRDAAGLLAEAGVSAEAIRLMNRWTNAPSLAGASALGLFKEAARSPHAPPAAGPEVPGEIVGGSATLPAAMAAALAEAPRYGAAVVGLSQAPGGIEVRLASGETLTADHVVVAAPLTAVAAIAFDPPLPPDQAAAVAGAVYARVTQVHLVPEAPFWDDDGLPPSLYVDGPLERVLAVETQGGVERLVCWFNGDGAVPWDAMTAGDRVTFAVAELARVRPSSTGKVRGAFSWSWAGALSGGIRHAPRPGEVLTLGPVLAQAHGRVRFAGEHVRRHEHGMEAACETGERAAEAILAI
jgi:monoamine oxidase